MSLDTDIDRLGRVPLLSAMNDEALRLLAFAAETCSFAADDVIFTEGDVADCGYLITAGSVEISGAETRSVGPGTLLGEQLLAGVGFELGKARARRRQHQIAFAQLGKPQQLQRFAEMKYLVGFELQAAGENRQIGVPVIGWSCQRLDQTRQHVGRNMVQDHADAGAENAFDRQRLRFGALGHAGIDAVDQLPEGRIEPVARVRQVDLDLGGDATGIGREHQNAVAHQDRLLDVVGYHQHRFDRQPAFDPQIDQVGAQRLGGEHIQRRKRLVHQQQVRMHHQRAGKPDALAHASRQFLGVGRFETVEADQIDRRQRPGAAFRAVDTECLEAEFDVLQHRQPWKQRERLKHHGDAVGRTVDHFAAASGVARGGRDQARDDSQQGRFARSGAAEQAHDLAGADGEVDLFKHQQLLAASLRKRAADIADIEQRVIDLVEHGFSL